MTTIKHATLPKDDRGNDPIDFKDDPEFISKINGKQKPNIEWVEQFKLTETEVDV